MPLIQRFLHWLGGGAWSEQAGQSFSGETASDLTGVWAGYYTHRDRPHAITAELVQTGEELGGTMHDAVTEFPRSLFELAVEAGLPPGADEQMLAGLRQQHPELPPGPVRYVSRLPADSVLKGRVRGPQVQFQKSYRGEVVAGYEIGGRLVEGASFPNHVVHYEGRLNVAGNLIEGGWSIPAPGTNRSQSGSFVLRRK